MADEKAHHAGTPQGDSTKEITPQQPNTATDTSQAAGDAKEKQNDPPGGFDSTRLPKRPPGYTVRITFHRATKLPLADLSTLSSDPYLTADVTTSLPTRHKEDPILRFRTHTIWRSLEPAWEEQWIIHHIPADGLKMKIRIYDEDSSDHDDRLGNVHVTSGPIDEKWQGITNQSFPIKKKTGSKRAYFLRALAVCFGKVEHMNGDMFITIECLGRSPGDDGSRAYTYGKQYWCKHYSPLLGRIVGSKDPESNKRPGDLQDNAPQAESQTDKEEVIDPSEKARMGDHINQDKSTNDASAGAAQDVPSALQKLPGKRKKNERTSQRYNFQANQFQLRGPVPEELYHRYVEFKPFIRALFTATGLRGFILSEALHHQHRTVYNFNRDTRYGVFEEPCQDMTLKFLDLVHYDEGGRIFTYVLTLDALFRFTETGKEFSIDLLSKHTMHSNASIYIAFSGEFFIRRLKRPHSNSHAESDDNRQLLENGDTHPPQELDGGPPKSSPPKDPAYYELVIDNDSGTYRPNAKTLPLLKHFLEENFPGLKVVTLDCNKDSELMNKLKAEQRERKKREQGKMVFQQISRSSSVSSGDEDRLNDLAGRADREFKASTSQQKEKKALGEKSPSDQDSSNAVRHKHKLGEALAPFAGSHEHIRAALGEQNSSEG